jgi:peptidyl-prolyl cis-trans isomerase D
MLQTIRSKTAGVVVKVLFIVLVGSFAIWGIGDYTFLRRTEQVAIRVGDTKITPEQLSIEYRREVDRLRRSFGQFDLELARQIGLMDQVVDRMVRDTLFQKEAARLGIVVSDDVIRARIAANPAFHGFTGGFDRNVFQRVLYENGYNEAQYVQLLRQELVRSAIVDAVTGGSRAPETLVDRLYRHRNERRVGETVFVPNNSIQVAGEPDDIQLKSVYDDNPERFSDPEFRALTVLRIGTDELVPTIQVTDQQLKEEFDSRIAEFRVPEKRNIEQMLFPTEEAAKAAAAKVAAGTPFTDVAREDAKQTPDQTELPDVQKQDLVPELADAVFALPEGGVTPPIKSSFGWHITRVAKIQPAKEPTLDEVKDKLRADLVHKLASNGAYDTAVKAEDALGSGSTLAEAAAKVGLNVVKVAAVNARGQNPKGETELVIADSPDALQAAFQTPQGQDSQLVEARGGGTYFLIHVDGVTPPRVKPIDEVRPQLISLWKSEQQSAGARKRAELIAQRLGEGKTLSDASAEFNLKPETTPAVLRDGSAASGRAASEVATQLFTGKVGDVGLAPAPDGFHVVRLTAIEPADPAKDADGVTKLRTMLNQQIGGDLATEFANALRARYPVTLDQEAIERVL